MQCLPDWIEPLDAFQGAYSIMLALWSLLIYAPLCHWVWGSGGWIAEMGALDFAGGWGSRMQG